MTECLPLVEGVASKLYCGDDTSNSDLFDWCYSATSVNSASTVSCGSIVAAKA